MSEKNEKTGATVTADKTNLVRLTFLPEGKTVEFEHGKLPYKEHGKPQSILERCFRLAHARRRTWHHDRC